MPLAADVDQQRLPLFRNWLSHLLHTANSTNTHTHGHDRPSGAADCLKLTLAKFLSPVYIGIEFLRGGGVRSQNNST